MSFLALYLLYIFLHGSVLTAIVEVLVSLATR